MLYSPPTSLLIASATFAGLYAAVRLWSLAQRRAGVACSFYTYCKLRWHLPFDYPVMPERKLPSDEEVFARKEAERAERRAAAARAEGE